MPKHLRERFLIRLDHGEFKVSPDLRKTVIFSEHDLLTDPPFTRLDLASCRNLMIYLKSRAQQRAVRSMQCGLKLNGYLFLGASESPGDAVADFEPVFRESKIYKKIREGVRRDRGDLTAPRVAPQNKLASTLGEVGLSRVYDLLLNRFVPPGVLVHEDRRLIHIFGDAHRFLVHSPGRVTDDLISMLPDDLSTLIAAGLRNASREQTSLRINAPILKKSFARITRLNVRSDHPTGHTYLRRIGVYRDPSGRFDGIVITVVDIGEVIDDEGRTDVELTNFVELLPAAAAVFDWSKIGEVDDGVPAYGRVSFDAHASGESLFTHRARVCAIGESKMIDAELNWAFVHRGERLLAVLVVHQTD